MRAEQRPPTAGIVACLAYLLLAFGPYALPETEVSGLGVYYSYGIAGPQFLSLIALVGVVLFAAGRQVRTDPVFVAGLTIVLGAVLSLLVLAWAATVPEDVVTSLGTADWLEYHRWSLVACSVAVAASAGWYARALELL